VVRAQHPATFGDDRRALSGRAMLDRIALLLLLTSPAIAAPAAANVAWPELCARLEDAAEREPDEIRRYRMLLNGRPAGEEVFRFWREGSDVRVLVDTRFDGRVWIFPADLRHCRDERWRVEAGGLELVELESATTYAVPFKPDYQIHIERDPERGQMVYRGSSRFDSFEERHPRNTGAITPWSVRTVHYERLLDLFAHGTYGIDSRLVETGTVGGDEVGLYAIGGEWPRRLWYQDDKMIRFCGREPFGTYIETVLDAYADRAIDEVGLSRPCAELFE
jgi:hypothetical protein